MPRKGSPLQGPVITHKQIAEAIRWEYPSSVTASVLAVKLAVHERTMNRRIREMRIAGLVEEVTIRGHYKLTDAGRAILR